MYRDVTDDERIAIDALLNSSPAPLRLDDYIFGTNAYVDQVISKLNHVYTIREKRNLGPVLLAFIIKNCSQPITSKSFDLVKKVLESNDTGIVEPNAEIILKAALVYAHYLQLSHFQQHGNQTFNTRDLYLGYKMEELEEIKEADAKEVKYLQEFQRMVSVAIQLIPPHRNKMLIMTICTLLEGSGRNYITGGTQSVASALRMKIFDQEVQKRNLITNVEASGTPAVPRKRKYCSCGSFILARTMWKHVQSKKHLTFSISLAQKTTSESQSPSDTQS